MNRIKYWRIYLGYDFGEYTFLSGVIDMLFSYSVNPIKIID